MHDSSISMKAVAGIYRKMEFSSYGVINYQDRSGETIRYIIVTGIHEELGLMIIRQSLVSADLLGAAIFVDPAEEEAFEAAIERGASVSDACELAPRQAKAEREALASRPEELQRLGRIAFGLAEAKAREAGVVGPSLNAVAVKGIAHPAGRELSEEGALPSV